MEIKKIKSVSIDLSLYEDILSYDISPRKDVIVLDHSDEFQLDSWGFGDLQEKLAEYLNYNQAVQDNSKIYCMPGHNINKSSWEILKNKGYSKTIDPDKSDHIAYKSDNLDSKLFSFSYRCEGYRTFTGIILEITEIIENTYGHNSKEAIKAKEITERLIEVSGLDPTNVSEYLWITVTNLYYKNHTAKNLDLYNVIKEFAENISDSKCFRRVYVQPDKESQLAFLLDNRKKLIEQKYVLKIASDDKQTMTFELFKEINTMLRSQDPSNRLLANRLIVSFNPHTSYAYLSLLFYLYHDHFYTTKDDFRDAVSKSFIAEYNKLNDNNNQSRFYTFGSVRALIDGIKKQNQFTEEVASVCLTIVRNEIMKNLSHYHVSIIDEARLRQAIVLK